MVRRGTASPLIGSLPVTRVEGVAYAVAGSLLVAVGTIGRMLDLQTLAVTVTFVGVAEVVTLVRRRVLPLKLVDFWIVGFLWLYGAELTASLASAAGLGGARGLPSLETQAMVQGFVVSAFGASLLAYGFAGHLLARVRIHTPRQEPTARSAKLLGLVLFACAWGAAIGYMWQGGQLLLSRAGAAEGAVGTVRPILTLAVVVVTAFPAVFLSTMAFIGRPARAVGSLMAVASVAAVFLTGTRFYLGFQMTGLLFSWLRLRGTLVSKRQLAWLGTGILVVWAGSAVMLPMRSVGVEAFVQQFDRAIVQATALQDEGLLSVLALAADSREQVDGSSEHLFLTYWWVPRSIWPTKPTMAGYWLIRETGGRYSAGQSVSGGFAFPLMIDFGPDFGVFFALFYGSFLLLLDRWASSMWARGPSSAAQAGILGFGTFFAMRSPITSLITVQGLLALQFLAVRLGGNTHATEARCPGYRGGASDSGQNAQLDTAGLYGLRPRWKPPIASGARSYRKTSRQGAWWR